MFTNELINYNFKNIMVIIFRFPKTVNGTLGIIAYFPFGVILVILRVFIAINALFLTIILSNYPIIRR